MQKYRYLDARYHPLCHAGPDPASSVGEHWIADQVRNDNRKCNVYTSTRSMPPALARFT